jgi:hypothetical protein
MRRGRSARVVGFVSLVLWGGSWYLVWKEIFHWQHMTKTLRFQFKDAPPGVPEPKPGLPVRALRVVALVSPVAAIVSFAAAVRRTGSSGRRRSRRP